MHKLSSEYRFVLTFLLILSTVILHAQRQKIVGAAAKNLVQNAREVVVDQKSDPRFIQFEAGTTFRNEDELSSWLNLPVGCELNLKSRSKDKIGHEHLKYSQTYNGLEIIGSEYVFHCQGVSVTSANGTIRRDITVNTIPSISEQQALQFALDAVGASAYMWEHEGNEQFIKRESKDSDASFFPSGKLAISSKNYEKSSELKLIYQFDIYASDPIGRYLVEVDANDGSIVNKINRIHHTTVDATGETLYDGTVPVKADFDGVNYSLTEDTRGLGVHTYDMTNGTDYGAATLFTEPDSSFDESNSLAGVSAHFGAGATYDYFLANFGRNSFDDAGAAIYSYAHFSTDYFNAFWDGSRMTYGDGDGITATALVSLDIVGHEIAHAVTQYSAGLIYSYESGALNESFSDIFGQAIEFETFPATASWNLADQIYTDGVSMIRSMSDPNSQGQPDTYLGDLWFTGSGDNGGVHFNSGVQNFWFYLLVDGGTGTNDHGDDYNVPSIGLEAAQQIAYRNLTVYLTSTSQYVDARVGAEQSATDLFGAGSAEYNAVVEAWNAVGVPTVEPMISVIDSLTFGEVPVQFTQELDLTISNLGNGQLMIYDIVSENGDFAASDTAFTVDALESFRLSVGFTPSVFGDFSSALTILSNDDTVSVSLTGIGVEPPNIVVSPDSINVALVSGDSAIRTLTIDNSLGESDLVVYYGLAFDSDQNGASEGFVFTPTNAAPAHHSSNVQNSQDVVPSKAIQNSSSSDRSILFFTDGSSGVILDALEGIEADITVYSQDYNGFISDLYSEDWDLVLFEAYYSWYDLDQMVPFVEDGGRLLSAYWDYQSNLAFCQAMKASWMSSFETQQTIHKWQNHPINTHPNSVAYPLTPNGSDVIYDNGDLFDPIGNALSIAGVTGTPSVENSTFILGNKGKTILNGFAFIDFTGVDNDFDGVDDISELAQNQILQLLNGGWLSISSVADTIPSGESATLDAILTTEGLNGGTYYADIQISNNDPTNSFIEIPVAMVVTGVPEISVNMDTLDFGLVFNESSSSLELQVSNGGTDVLSIFDIVVDNPDFNVDSTSYLLDPGQNFHITVHYTPSAIEQDDGSLWIISDAVNQDSLLLHLMGTSNYPPVINNLSDSIHDQLNSGDSAIHTILISNQADPGASDLIYNVGMESAGTTELRTPHSLRKSVVQTIPEGVQYHDGRVLVKIDPEATNIQIQSLKQTLNATTLKTYRLIDVELWSISNLSVTEALVTYQNDPRITYIEPDYTVAAIGIPDDPRFGDLWGLENTGQTGGTYDADVDVSEAWGKGTGSKNMVIGVIDTGIDYDHEDLANNMWINEDEIPDNGIDDDLNGYIDDIYGWDFYNNDNDPFDDNGHGTHCSGTLAAEGNNGIGVVGVNWNASLMALKFLGSGGTGSTSDAIEAVEYATMNGVHLTSNSWGGGGYSAALEEAIWAAHDANQLFIAAAGNNGTDNDVLPHYPSSYVNDNVIAVAATDHNDELASFSSFGATSVDLAAPGVDILSTTPGNNYGYLSGTSMATPHVSGAVALAWSNAPFLTNLEIKQLILDHVDQVDAISDHSLTGGRLNVNEVMKNAFGWISSNISEGVLAPQTSDNLVVTLNATGLNEGVYSGNVVVTSNDPVNLIQSIAVSLFVDGLPKIEIPFDTILFDAFSGYEDKKYITISNTGTDSLFVNNIYVDSIVYALDTITMKIGPGEEEDLGITFQPVSSGTINSILTFESNDPADSILSIILVGSAIDPPVFLVSTDSLSEELFAEDSSIQVVTVENPGNSDLIFSTSVNYYNNSNFEYSHLHTRLGEFTLSEQSSDITVNPSQSSSAIATEVNVLVIQNTSAWGLDMATFLADHFEIDPTVIGYGLLASTDLQLYDLIITVGDENGLYYSALSENVAKLETFVQSGGILQYQLATQGDNVNLVGGAFMKFGNHENFNKVVDEDHAIVEGLPTNLEGNWANHCYVQDLPTGANVIIEGSSSQLPTMIEYSFGGGRVIATGMTVEFLYMGNFNSSPLLGQMTDYSLELASSSWLATNPVSQTIPAGGSLQMEVLFNATDLNAGTYFADLKFESNDPSNGLKVVPVDLHVTGSPNINVNEDSIAFGDVFVETTAVRSFDIINEGSDSLVVWDILTENPDFRVDTTSFTVPPDQFLQLNVFYDPFEVEVDNSLLHVISNDPNQDTLTINLIGSGLEPPVIQIIPDSLSDALNSGENSSQSVNIDNSQGGSVLEWEINVQYASTTFNTGLAESDVPLLFEMQNSNFGIPGSGTSMSEGYKTYTSVIEEDYIDFTPEGIVEEGFSPGWANKGYEFLALKEIAILGAEWWIDLPIGGFIRASIYDESGNLLARGNSAVGDGLGEKWYYSPLQFTFQENETYILSFYCNVPGIAIFDFIGDAGFGPFTLDSLISDIYSRSSTTTSEEVAPLTDNIWCPFQRLVVNHDLWLHPSPEFGSTPAGNVDQLVVNFNANGLIGGQYEANIVVSSNDPAQPMVTIDVDLNVTSAPNLFVDTMIVVGKQLVGDSASHAVEILNTGVEDLVVSSIFLVDGVSAFFTDTSSFTITAGGNQLIYMGFAPDSSGVYNDTLVIESNDPSDPNLFIPVEGEGVNPANISVNPDFLVENLFTGQLSTQHLYISNAEESADLEVNLSIGGSSPPVSQVNLVSVGPKPYEEIDPESGEPSQGYLNTFIPGLQDLSGHVVGSSQFGTFESDLADRGAEIVGLPLPITSTYLEGVDLLIFDDLVGNLSGGEIDLVRSWTINGNSLFLMGDNSHDVNNQILNGSGIILENWGYINSIFTDIEVHPVTDSIHSIEMPGALARLMVSGPAIELVRDSDESVAVAISQQGNGKVFVAGDEIAYRIHYGDNRRLINQAADWLLNPSFFALGIEEGTVPAGDSLVVPVYFDAQHLDAGNYQVSVQIENSDPNNSLVSVPVDLNVSGIADLQVGDSIVAFENTSIGLQTSRSLNLFNAGNVDLVIDSIVIDNNKFSVDSTSMSILPGDDYDLLVYYLPDSIQVDSANLILYTNDFDDSVKTVFLHGNGIEPPVISVDPDSISAILQAGDSVDLLLEIGNFGANDLIFDAIVRMTSETYSGKKSILVIQDYLPEPIGISEIIFDHFGIATKEITALEMSLEDFSEYGLIITAPYQGQTFYTMISSEVSRFEDFVSEGGSIMYLNANNTSVSTQMPGGVKSNGQIWNDPNDVEIESVITRGYSDVIHLFANGNHENLVPGSVIHTIGRTTGDPTTITYSIGDGSVFSSTIHATYAHNYYFGGIRNLILNWFEWGVSQPTPAWVSFVHGDTLAAGASKMYEVSLNARDLYAGNIQAEIDLLTNDPLSQIVNIPVDLFVEGQPQILVTDTLEFLEAYNDFSYHQAFRVKNVGSDTLLMENVVTDESRFTPEQVAGKKIPPGRMESYLVTFRSETSGVFNGSLDLESNDTLNPVVSVPLYGESGIKPTVELADDFVNLQVYPELLSEYEMNVGNPGEYDLEYLAYIGHVETSTGAMAKGSIGFWAENRPLVPLTEFDLSTISEEPAQGFGQGSWIDTLYNIPTGINGTVKAVDTLYLLSGDNNIFKYNIQSEVVFDTIRLIGNTFNSNYGLTFDGDHLWVGESNGNVFGYDLEGNFIGSFSTPFLSDITFTYIDGSFLVADAFRYDNMYLIDFTGSVLDTITINRNLRNINYAGDGYLWSGEFSCHSLLDLNDALESRITSFCSGAYGYGAGFSEGKLYLPHYGDGYMAVVDGHVDGIEEGISLKNRTGTIEPGQQDSVILTINTSSSPGEILNFDIYFRSNDPHNYQIPIPVTITVINDPPVVEEISDLIMELDDQGIIALDLFFSDPNDEVVEYEYDVTTPDIVVLEVQGDSLHIDPQQIGSTQVTVTGYDKYGDFVSTSFEITIIETKVPPVIDPQTFEIEENPTVMQLIGKIVATDQNHDQLHFTILNGNETEAVILEDSGTLFVDDSTFFNYETTQRLDLIVEVDDGLFTDTATISVIVMDIMEAPVLLDQNFIVEENLPVSTQVGIISAYDDDQDPLQFDIVSGSDGAFRVEDSLLLVDDQSLINFEEKSFFNMVMTVSDGELSDTAFMTVQLLDIQDPPTIRDDAFELPENSPTNTEVGTVTANDEDGDELSYSIIGGNELNAFKLSTEGKILVEDVEPINYEIYKTFELQIVVSDAVSQDTAAVTIEILDTPENPLIEDQIFTIDEHSPEGTEIGVITASDEDGDSISFEILFGNNTGAFQLTSGGKLSIADPSYLDYERFPEFELLVEASDGSLSSSATITINVSDVTENAPPVMEDQTFEVPEHSPQGYLVGQIIASDAENDSLTFTIIFCDAEGDFDLNPDGSLHINDSSRFDFESKKTFELFVEVSDGTASDSAFVTVNVLDISENKPPVFNDQTFSIREDLPEGSEIGQITAADPDGDPLVFDMVEGDDSHLFSLSSHGLLTNARELDDKGIYKLSVSVSDGVYSSEALIMVITENDDEEEENEAPEINDQDFTVLENVPNGTLVGTIEAVDEDEDMLKYYVMSSTNELAFDVDSLSGEITVADSSMLDYETLRLVSFVVKVSDGLAFDVAIITIEISDLDEDNGEQPLALGSQSELSLYPNPVTHYLSVHSSDPLVELIITDTHGKELVSYTHLSTQYLNIDSRKLVPGIYFIMIKSESNIRVLRFIKQ